jgi:lysophospholipase L1-like esterase
MDIVRVIRHLVPVLTLLFTLSCSGGPTGPTIDFNDQVIVAFGNSITSGVGDSRYPSSAAGYPFRLEQLLQASYPRAIVLNRGVRGELVEEGERRLSAVLGYDNPDFVLILEGVNNIPQDSTEHVARALERMVQMVEDFGAVPLIGSLTPTAGPRAFKNEGIELVNIMIRDIAVSHGIGFVDLHAAFLDEPDPEVLLDADGLHPNGEGYQVMAQAWFEGMLGSF